MAAIKKWLENSEPTFVVYKRLAVNAFSASEQFRMTHNGGIIGAERSAVFTHLHLSSRPLGREHSLNSYQMYPKKIIEDCFRRGILWH